MIKAFLSHSSKDKESYVEIIANYLGKENIVYDKYTFDKGEITLNEILRGLDSTAIFVIFISENALESEWVKREIFEAKDRYDENIIKRIIPIIIDNTIKHDDKKIPDWLKDRYNIQPIARPSVAARKILNKLREISWGKHPDLKKRESIFVGRNDKLEEFEQRIHDFDHEKPIAIITSGLPGVGRRTFLHNANVKTNISELCQKPISIFLDRDSSIEDLLIKLNDLGLIDMDNEITSLIDKTLEQKTELIHKVMMAAYEAGELIYIIDNGSIISYQRKISDWFIPIITKFTASNHPIFCIVSKYKITLKNRPHCDKFYFIELSELNSDERKRLLSQLLSLKKTEIDKENFLATSDLLFGFPEQVAYAADIISLGTEKFSDKLTLIREYNSDKAGVLLRKYSNDDTTLDFIRLLAQFEIISKDFLFSIVPEEKYYPLLENLIFEYIAEVIGADNEFIRLNDAVRDYIKRNKLKLRDDFSQKISAHVTSVIKSDDLLQIDSSQFIYSLKEQLKTGSQIDTKLLIPSHYLRCMKDLYYNKDKMNRIIELADIILQKENNLDNNIAQDIRYYLCLALARNRNQRMLTEVQRIRSPEHQFLLGFYYRLQGRYADALLRLLPIKDEPHVDARAKREIVQIYVQVEEFDKALEYAKNNYLENKGNQFHTQAYFNCLINSESTPETQRMLTELISNLRTINSDQSNEMADIADAIFKSKINKNKTGACDLIGDCILKHPNNHYPILTLCDIGIYWKDKEILQRGIRLLKALPEEKQRSIRTINKYEALLLALQGKKSEALLLINKDLDRYPIESKEKIIKRITDYSNQI